MLFGVGIPILYPIALVSFIIVFLLEKYMLYYVYRLPQKYDGFLYSNVVEILRKCSIFSVVSSFW